MKQAAEDSFLPAADSIYQNIGEEERKGRFKRKESYRKQLEFDTQSQMKVEKEHQHRAPSTDIQRQVKKMNLMKEKINKQISDIRTSVNKQDENDPQVSSLPDPKP